MDPKENKRQEKDPSVLKVSAITVADGDTENVTAGRKSKTQRKEKANQSRSLRSTRRSRRSMLRWLQSKLVARTYLTISGCYC